MNHCRIHPTVPRPAAAQLDAVAKLPSTIVSDQLERYGFAAGLGQITRNELGILSGPALTVRTRPGDNLIIYKAIQLAEPGDILVIDAGGATDRAVMGEIVAHHAHAQGVAGLVIDGCVRDGAEIAAGDMPVYCRGYAHPGPFKNGPGEIRGTVSVGGAVVRQGDIIVADADGVAICPIERLDETITGGQEALAREDKAIALAKSGNMDTSWVDDKLEVVYVDGAEAPATEGSGGGAGEVLYPNL